jgi:hypothetical protein
MATAKDLLVKPIKSADAIAFVKAHHYSGKVAQNSQLHLGVFLDGRLHGCMQFGPSLDKRKIQGLVSGTQWHEFLELNRMAFDDVLPRNSESRALSVAFRMIRKNAPQVKWIISFADGTQCGDGTIYRAAGFVLTGITENKNLARLADGSIIHKMTLESNPLATDYGAINEGKNDFSHYLEVKGGERLTGFQLRYIYFLDPSYRARLTVPELPYSEIERRGAKMYKGQKPGDTGEIDSAPQSNAETEGASPIVSLLQVTE